MPCVSLLMCVAVDGYWMNDIRPIALSVGGYDAYCRLNDHEYFVVEEGCVFPHNRESSLATTGWEEEGTVPFNLVD